MDFVELNKESIIKIMVTRLRWVSLIVLTLVLSARVDTYNNTALTLIGVCVAACVWGYLLDFKSDWFETCLDGRKKTIISVISAIETIIWLRYAVKFFLIRDKWLLNSVVDIITENRVEYDSRVIGIILFVSAFYGAFLIVRIMVVLCYKGIVYFGKKADKVEKVYIMSYFVIFGGLMAWIYVHSTAFYSGGIYNILYTFDSNTLYNADSFILIGADENDIRQSLFAVFSLPISLPARFFSLLLPFRYSYALFLQLLQIVLLGIGNVLITRMMCVSKKRKIAVLLFISVMCESILFSLLLEQYIILVFVLIVTTYCIVNKKGNREVAAVGLVGTAPTSFVMLFWELKNRDSIIDFVKYGISSFIFFVGALICFGQFGLLMHFYDNTVELMRYAEHVGLVNKMRQFLYFVRSCFIGPSSYSTTWQELPVIRMSEITGTSIVGVLLVIAVFIAIFINRKDVFAKMCLTWVLFSVVLLVIIGFNAATNDYFLFVHYFGWAFASLLLMGLSKIVKRDAAFNALIYALSGIMVVYNSIYFAKLINFAIKNYAI